MAQSYVSKKRFDRIAAALQEYIDDAARRQAATQEIAEILRYTEDGYALFLQSHRTSSKKAATEKRDQGKSTYTEAHRRYYARQKELKTQLQATHAT